MLFSEDPVQYPFPVLELNFTPDEIHNLLSLSKPELPVHSTSGSETNRSVYSLEEQKQRKMLSNRESAKRSRWKKKRHIENLTNQMTGLRLQNRVLKSRLCLVTYECRVVQIETDRFITEYIELQQKLSCLCQVLVSMQLH